MESVRHILPVFVGCILYVDVALRKIKRAYILLSKKLNLVGLESTSLRPSYPYFLRKKFSGIYLHRIGMFIQ